MEYLTALRASTEVRGVSSASVISSSNACGSVLPKCESVTLEHAMAFLACMDLPWGWEFEEVQHSITTENGEGGAVLGLLLLVGARKTAWSASARSAARRGWRVRVIEVYAVLVMRVFC